MIKVKGGVKSVIATIMLHKKLPPNLNDFLLQIFIAHPKDQLDG